MGYIKKLKNNELVGGTDKTTIYPVTSAEAVFEEVSESNFKSQKFLNNNITGDRINKETITDYNIAVGTVTKGKLTPQVQTMLDEGQKKALTPKGNYNLETEYEALDLVFDPVTNSSYISLVTPNVGHPVDENAEGYEEGWWEKTLDGTAVNTAQATINNKVDQLDAQVDDAIDQARDDIQGLINETAEALQEATDEANNAAGEARDAASTVETLTSQQVADAQIGYFTCTDTAASGAAANETKITTTDTIGVSTYTKTVGSHVKVKMAVANTHAAPVYLQFGSNTANKAQLYYNGEPANASNSWDVGETISVYYDGQYYQASNAQGGSNKKIDAYLLGDLRTLAVGQVYREGEFIKTTDKQLLKIVKPIRYMMLDEPVAVGDARVVGSITYVANTAVSNYNESTTYTEGAYALIDGWVNVFDGETWTPITSMSTYASAPIWESVDANYLSNINNGFVVQNTTESHIDDDILKRVGDYTEIISIPLSGRNSGHIYGATGGVVTINETSSTNNYCVVNPVDVTQYSKVYINYCIPSSAGGGTYFTDDNGFIIGSVLKAATNNNTYYEYDVPEGATKLYVSNARNYAINNIKIDSPHLKARLCKTVKDNTDILYKRTDYLTDDILPIKLNTIYHIGEILKSEDGSILVVNKNVTKLKNTENLAVGDIKIYSANLTYQAKKAITEYTGDDTNYTDGDYARGTFASKVLNISVDNPTEGEITIKVGDEEYSVPITSESTDERLAETIAELVFSEWSGSANGSAVTFVHSTIGAISDPFTITVSSDSGVTITPSYTNGTEIIRVYNEGSWTNISTFNNNDLSALFDEIDNVDTLASIITVSDNIHNHINAEILMSLPDYCGNYIGSSGTLWKSATDTLNAYLIPIEAGKYYKIKGTPNTQYAFMASMSMSGAPQYATGYSNVIISGEESSWLKAPNNAVALYALGINSTTRIITVKTKLPIERLVDSLSAEGTSYDDSNSGRGVENVQDALSTLFDDMDTNVSLLDDIISVKSRSNGFFKDAMHYNKSTTSPPSYYGYWYNVTDYVGERLAITANDSYFSRIVFSPRIINATGDYSSELLGEKCVQITKGTTRKIMIPSNGGGNVYIWIYTYNNGIDMTPASVYLLGSIKDSINVPNEKIIYRKQIYRELATARHTWNSTGVLTFVCGGDIHGSLDTGKEFYEISKYYEDKIDFAVLLGDLVYTNFVDDFTYWDKANMGNIWTIIGNHDTRANGAWGGAGQEAVYNKFIKDYIDLWGVTKQDASVDPYACYYYKDFALAGGYTIRVLAIDCMFVTDIQKAWIQDRLDEALAGDFRVVILCHYPACNNPSSYINTRTDINWSTMQYVNFTGSNVPASQIVPVVNMVSNFIDSGGKFIAWFNGHRHYDEIGYSSLDSDLLDITVEKCANTKHEFTYIPGDISEHSFTFVVIDPARNLLKLIRYGNHINDSLREKNLLCYNYVTKTVISQS